MAHGSPCPGTSTSASNSARRSATPRSPPTEPMRTKGVPPLKTRSPLNRTPRSGIQATTSLVVCAAVPKWWSSTKRSSTWTCSWSSKVTNGGAATSSPHSTWSQNPVEAQDAGLHDRLTAALVADDRRVRQQAVPVGVVAVVVGVHEHPRRGPRDPLDGVEVGDGPCLGRAGVDAEHEPRAGDEAGVVDPPGPVRLDVGEDPVGDLHDARRPGGAGRDRQPLVARGGHGADS